MAKTNKEIIMAGLIDENPTFVQLLGMCPTLAVTTSLSNGIGMGLSVTAVLIASNFMISLFRKVIPNKVRIAAYIVIIAAFVTIIEMCLDAFVPALSASLGIFIPLIVVNCIILSRAEAFASKNSPAKSALDGLAMGIGFTIALCIISAIREFLGTGAVLGYQIYGETIKPASIVTLAPGGFIILGLIIGIKNLITMRGGSDNA